MRKLLLLAGIFTVLAYNAQARYYYDENQPRKQHQILYSKEPKQFPQYYRISKEEEKNYNERKYMADNSNTIRPYIGLNLGITTTKFSDTPLINDKTLSDHNLIIAPNIGIRSKYLGLEAFYHYSEKSKKILAKISKVLSVFTLLALI